MALLLNIDTALENASVCLAKGEAVVAFAENSVKNQTASWLHEAIKEMAGKAGITLQDIDAVAVSNGPGSYTGLRIGLATAKGLCYALQIPLICINTLTLMASAVKDKAEEFIVPMIDARRMEVFTALFDKELNIIKQPEATILSPESYADILTNHKVLFTGDGTVKFKSIVTAPTASFIEGKVNALNMLGLSQQRFEQQMFNDLAYTEPFYIKNVYTK